MASFPWLGQVARTAGLSDAAALSAESAETVGHAWAKVAEAAGISEMELAGLVAAQFHLEVADLSAGSPQVAKLVPEAMARRFGVVPLTFGNAGLVAATANPVDFEAERELGFVAGRVVKLQIAPPSLVGPAIEALYRDWGGLDDALERLVRQADTSQVDVISRGEEEQITRDELEAAPIVKLTNLILDKGAQLGASDIHIEPDSSGGRVRVRIDGVLQPIMRIPGGLLIRVVSRIKITADMDIADRLRPQDGKIRAIIGGEPYDLRISTVPTREGEKAVIRLLRPEGLLQLEELGIAHNEAQQVFELLNHRDGIVIVTGPTGSGKTTTLYAALQRLSSGELNISTVENPVEYEIPGITQIQVNEKQGMTFASALKALLRQDPDVILVGEIRDPETAQTAAQASMTGHLVLSTLHTNDAVGVIGRLAALNLDPATLANTLRGVISQRLLRKLCTTCSMPVEGPQDLSEKELEIAARLRIKPSRKAVGCPDCSGSGYKGRIPVNEVIRVTPEIRDLIYSGAGLHDMERTARAQGMRNIWDCAAEMVKQGRTTLTELDRVLGETAKPRSEADPIEEVAPPAEVEEAPVPAGPTQVLVIEDDASQRLLLKGALEALGYAVVAADGGQAGLDALLENPGIDVVVTDLMMEPMDGLELVTALRASPAHAGLPVVVLTASEDPTKEVELLRAGADDYLRKPIDLQKLELRVKGVLRRSGL